MRPVSWRLARPLCRIGILALALTQASCRAFLPMGGDEAERARRAWRIIYDKEKKPKMPVEELGWLNKLVEWLQKYRLAVVISALVIIVLVIILSVVFSLVNRQKRNLKAREKAQKAKEAKGPDAKAVKAPSESILFSQASNLAQGGDYSQAVILLRKAVVLDCMRLGGKTRLIERGDRAWADYLNERERDGKAFLSLCRRANLALFGRGQLGSEDWTNAVAEYRASLGGRL